MLPNDKLKIEVRINAKLLMVKIAYTTITIRMRSWRGNYNIKVN